MLTGVATGAVLLGVPPTWIDTNASELLSMPSFTRKEKESVPV